MLRKLILYMPVLVPIGFILVFLGFLLHESIRVLGYAMVAFGLTAFVISNVLTEHDAKSKKEYEAKHSPRTMQNGMAVYKRYIGKSKFGAGDVLLDAYEIEFSYTVDTIDGSNPIIHKVKTYDLVHDKDAAVCMWMSQKDMPVDIEVFGSYCEIKTDLSQYYNEDIYLIDKEDAEKMTSYDAEDNTAGLNKALFFRYVSFMAPILLIAGYLLFTIIKEGSIFTLRTLIFISLILIAALFAILAYKQFIKWQTAVNGVDEETSEFTCYQTESATNNQVHDYYVEYTFVTASGIKLKSTDKIVDYVVYERLKNMETIPIKVYGKYAVLNVDRIQK